MISQQSFVQFLSWTLSWSSCLVNFVKPNIKHITIAAANSVHVNQHDEQTAGNCQRSIFIRDHKQERTGTNQERRS